MRIRIPVQYAWAAAAFTVFLHALFDKGGRMATDVVKENGTPLCVLGCAVGALFLGLGCWLRYSESGSKSRCNNPLYPFRDVDDGQWNVGVPVCVLGVLWLLAALHFCIQLHFYYAWKDNTLWGFIVIRVIEWLERMLAVSMKVPCRGLQVSLIKLLQYVGVNVGSLPTPWFLSRVFVTWTSILVVEIFQKRVYTVSMMYITVFAHMWMVLVGVHSGWVTSSGVREVSEAVLLFALSSLLCVVVKHRRRCLHWTLLASVCGFCVSGSLVSGHIPGNGVMGAACVSIVWLLCWYDLMDVTVFDWVTPRRVLVAGLFLHWRFLWTLCGMVAYWLWGVVCFVGIVQCALGFRTQGGNQPWRSILFRIGVALFATSLVSATIKHWGTPPLPSRAALEYLVCFFGNWHGGVLYVVALAFPLVKYLAQWHIDDILFGSCKEFWPNGDKYQVNLYCSRCTSVVADQQMSAVSVSESLDIKIRVKGEERFLIQLLDAFRVKMDGAYIEYSIFQDIGLLVFAPLVGTGPQSFCEAKKNLGKAHAPLDTIMFWKWPCTRNNLAIVALQLAMFWLQGYWDVRAYGFQ